MAIRNFHLVFLGISWFFLSGSGTFAQEKQGANWLFGGRVHMDFNGAWPVVSNFSFNPADTTIGGVATISDKNGNLLFFTSKGMIATRQKINGVYQPMPNGNFFAGNHFTNTTAEMIVQSPGDSNIYYLFFNGDQLINTRLNNGLFQLQVDMRLNNGYGDVVPNSLKVIRNRVAHLKLAAFLHQNNHDTWIMVSRAYRSFSNQQVDSIFAYLLTPTGIKPPVITVVTTLWDDGARIKAAPNSEMFVIASNSDVLQGADLYDFNRATGVPTFRYSLPNLNWLPAPNPRYPFYSFAFSPDNSKLYVGTHGFPIYPLNTNVYQYDLNAGTPAQVQQSRNLIYHSTNSIGVSDMQLGIDGRLYLYTSFTHLSQVNCPDFYGPACNFQENSVNLNGSTYGLTLPSLNQTIFRNAGKLQANAERNTICEGDFVRLSAFGAGAEQFRWQAANGLPSSSETLANPLVSPTTTTTYRVIGAGACNSDTAFVKVTVLPRPAAITVTGPAKVYTFAEKQVYTVPASTTGSKFNWQVSGGNIISGQESNSILVNWGAAGTGTVSVTETNTSGCAGEKKEILVEVSGEPSPEFYNIITPNNDNKNDAFVIGNLKWYPENNLKIYNRWGQEVYQSTNCQNNWQAQKLSSGVYYYLFKTRSQSWKGWVEVLK